MADFQDKHRLIAQRYAKALIGIARDKNSWTEIFDDLSQIVEVFDQNPAISAFFLNPIIKIQDKKEVLNKSFKGKVTEIVYDFLNVLLDKNRIYLLDSVKNIFEEQININNNVINVVAISAFNMSEDLKDALKSKLESKLNKKIQLKTHSDPEIIGGVIVKYGDNVIDGSVKTKLELMKKQLV